MKILLIPILLIPILLIPTVIITFIYKLLYNHHLNKTLKAKLPNKWLPPFTVGIITFFILNIMIVLTVIMGYKTYHSHSEVTVKSTSSTCAFKEVENSPYQIFNGSEVSGYDKTEKTDGNFHYYIYKNNSEVDNILPKYILLMEYRGNQKVQSFLADFTFETEDSSSSEGTYGNASSKYIAVLDIGSAIEKVYSESQEDAEVTDVDYMTTYTFRVYNMDEESLENLDSDSQAEKAVDSLTLTLED